MKTKNTLIFGLAIMTLMVMACEPASDEGVAIDDGENQSFLVLGKADDSAKWRKRGLFVLTIVNSLPEKTLISSVRKGGVALGFLTVGAIINRRPFLSITELDKAPFVGPIAFRKLTEYATKHYNLGPAPADVGICRRSCTLIAKAYDDSRGENRCTAACNIIVSAEDTTDCGYESAGCDWDKRSSMLELFQVLDPQLVTRADEDGVMRIDHTRTAWAHRSEAERDTRLADSWKRSMDKSGKDYRSSIADYRASAVFHRLLATHHSLLANIAQLSGRE